MKITNHRIKTYFILMTVALAIFFSSCSSSKKSLQRGDYYTAVMTAIRQLRSSPDNKKQQQVLLQAYSLANENGLRKIRNAMDMNVPNKYSIAADEYLALNRIADAIYTSPAALRLIPRPTQYSRELGEILSMAAEEAYSLGDQQLRHNTILSAREAYYYFTKANEYVSGYRDVYNKINIALEMATLKVVVTKPVTPRNYQLSADFFYNNLMSQISQATANRFVRFYSEEEASRLRLTNPDHYLIFEFNEFMVGAMRESSSTVQLSRDSVLVGTTTIQGRTQNVYGTVRAEFTTFRREVIAQGVLSARIHNIASNRTIEHRNFSGSYTWYNEWASYKGDERALSDRQRQMSRTQPLMPPSQQNLFIEFTKPIYDQSVSYVRNYYSRYTF